MKTYLDVILHKYGKKNIMRWCHTLKLFRLCLTHPYPDDFKPDRFVTIISVTSQEELANNLTALNFTPDESNTRGAKFHDYSENFSAGWVLIAQKLCHLEVNKLLKTVTIDVSGTQKDPFDFGEETFENAKEIENFLLLKDFTYRDPPYDEKYCVSPKTYPQIWNEDR